MHKNRKKVLLLGLALMLGTILCGCNSKEITESDGTSKDNVKKEILTEASEIVNGDLKLSLNVDDGAISVTDTKTGNTWSSNPSSDVADPIVSGKYKTMIKSQIYITYTTKKWKEETANSYAGCVADGNMSCFAVDGGYRVEYNFADVGIVVPVEYRISDRRLSANVVLADIKENGDNLLNTVTLLPFFGTASTEDEGIMFIPDGSGAVIEMNNGKTNCADYSKKYYGEDASYPQTQYSSDTQELLLPVFGMVKNDGAFLARIISGAELATLNATIAEKYTSYNIVNTTVEYRGRDQESALKQDKGSGYAYMPDEPVSLDTYCVDYIFSDNPSPSYSDLVEIYRSELSEGILSKEDTAATQNKIYIDLYGGITKKKAVLGIVYNGKVPVTTYTEMQQILEDLTSESEQTVSARILHYSEGEFSKTAGEAVEPVAFLGNDKSYQTLLDYCSENDIRLFPSANINSMKKNGNGLSKYKDVVSDMTKQSVLLAKYDVAAGEMVVDKNSWYLLTAEALLKSAEKTVDSMEKYQLDGISLTADSLQLYSDFGKMCTDRNEMREAYEEVFQTISKKGKLSFEKAYEYMLPYAAEIHNVPISSGSHQLFDYDVPFYQMVMMGRISYSSNSYNTVNPTYDYFLSCVESLTAVKFTVGKDESELLGQEDLELHNIEYNNLKSTIIEYSNKMAELCRQVDGAVMVDFYRINGVSVGIYDNGVVVYTNHNEQECLVGDVLVPALDFLVIGGEQS